MAKALGLDSQSKHTQEKATARPRLYLCTVGVDGRCFSWMSVWSRFGPQEDSRQRKLFILFYIFLLYHLPYGRIKVVDNLEVHHSIAIVEIALQVEVELPHL